LTAENVNNIEGTHQLLKDLPSSKYPLAGKGYNANWFSEGLQQRGIVSCIPYRCNHAIIRGTTTLRQRPLQTTS